MKDAFAELTEARNWGGTIQCCETSPGLFDFENIPTGWTARVSNDGGCVLITCPACKVTK